MINHGGTTAADCVLMWIYM